MRRPFEEVLQEWKDDDFYAILDDCEWDYSDVPEPELENGVKQSKESK